jgi:phage/plasmid-like protein (TIGR03299 family)
VSHNIFGNRFYSDRQPAWHGLGIVTEEPLDAQTAFTAMGPYDVHMEAVKVEGVAHNDYRAIVRDPVPDAPEMEVFGMVKGKYNLVTPQQFVEVWDAATGIKLQTMGALNGGRQLFMCAQLEPFKVLGTDEVKPYMLAVNDMTGGAADEVRLTPVRTVCENTLQLARARSTELYKVQHDGSALRKLGEWLKGLAEKIEGRRIETKAYFDTFARTQMTDEVTEYVLTQVYPFPPMVRSNAPDEVIAKKAEDRDNVIESMKAHRQAVRDLFEGKAVGFNEMFPGSAWSLYNCVAELENYRTGPAGSRGQNILFGIRGRRMEVAFDNLLAYAEGR